MLKSHFNILRDDEEPKAEEEVEAEVVAAEEEIPERPLDKPEISVRLSLLGKTAEGDGYTYLKATLKGMRLTNISAVKNFTNLMFLDVSNNFLDLNALQAATELPFLILIQADHNRLQSAALKQMKYLQVIIMNYNQITSVEDIFQEQMSTIELGYNKIEKLNFKNEMQNVKVLDFRHNLLTDIANLNFPNLDSLYVAGNKITSLVGIENLPNLRVLHARNNPIKLLNGFEPTHKKLKYINLRNTKVSTVKQIKKLKVLVKLEVLMMKGCPYMGGTGVENEDQPDEDPETRSEVLAILPRLKRLNRDEVTDEEREEAKDLMRQWLEEGEKDEEEEVEEEEQIPEEQQEQQFEP